MLFLPRPWERRRESSVLPDQGGKVCSRFCLFPFFIPPFILTPGCSDGAYLEQLPTCRAATLDVKAGSCLEVPPLLDRQSQLPGPLPQQLPALEKPAHF